MSASHHKTETRRRRYHAKVSQGRTDERAVGGNGQSGSSIALFNVEGTFYAIDNTCTHRGGPLGEGELKGDTVECPWHGAHFNVKTGAVTVPPAPSGVRSFPVKVEGSEVLVEVD